MYKIILLTVLLSLSSCATQMYNSDKYTENPILNRTYKYRDLRFRIGTTCAKVSHMGCDTLLMGNPNTTTEVIYDYYITTD